MVRPHIVTHALLSSDGRLEGFAQDVGLYYEVAGQLPHDAILAGSGTMIVAANAAGVDLSAPDEPAGADAPPADAALPLMVVVDSRGRLTRFDWLRSTGLWRDVLVLGSDRTPAGHRALLHAAGVELETYGEDKVDLPAALRSLRRTRGIATMRVDAGAGLNSVLWGAGLIDEVSLLIAPYLVGQGRSLLDAETSAEATHLTLSSAERQRDGHVWLRYAVSRG